MVEKKNPGTIYVYLIHVVGLILYINLEKNFFRLSQKKFGKFYCENLMGLLFRHKLYRWEYR